MNPARLRPLVRRFTFALAALGCGYLVWRFDMQTLPESGCSPLVQFSPGSALLLDRRPPEYGVGDALFFRGSDGRLYLGLVEQAREDGSVWVVVDNAACQGVGSERFGWIAAEDRVARVVMVWPW